MHATLMKTIFRNNACDGSILLGDGVDGVEDAGDVPEDGEQEADPELMPASELEEDAEGREDDGDDDVDAGGRAHGRSLNASSLGR